MQTCKTSQPPRWPLQGKTNQSIPAPEHAPALLQVDLVVLQTRSRSVVGIVPIDLERLDVRLLGGTIGDGSGLGGERGRNGARAHEALRHGVAQGGADEHRGRCGRFASLRDSPGGSEKNSAGAESRSHQNAPPGAAVPAEETKKADNHSTSFISSSCVRKPFVVTPPAPARSFEVSYSSNVFVWSNNSDTLLLPSNNVYGILCTNMYYLFADIWSRFSIIV